MLTINKDSLDKDCSKRIHPMHYVAFKGVIIWPLRRAGEKVGAPSITFNADEIIWTKGDNYGIEI